MDVQFNAILGVNYEVIFYYLFSGRHAFNRIQSQQSPHHHHDGGGLSLYRCSAVHFIHI